MFTFAQTPVKFVVLLILYAFCTACSAHEITRPQDVRQRVSNALHLAMSVVMLLMVSPLTWKALTAVIPTMVWVAVFGASTAWFGWLAADARRADDRSGTLHFIGHAAMFGAMTWHLAAMAAKHSAMTQGMGTPMPGGGTDMTQWMKQQSMPGGTLWVFALVGVPFMTYLLVSSLRSLWHAFQTPKPLAAGSCPCGPGCTCGPECSCQAGHPVARVIAPDLVAVGGRSTAAPVAQTVATTHSCHEVRPAGSLKFRLESLAAFAMNFGMFWMSTGLMVALLPFFAWFAF
ncbi:MAG: DUF5134 domain-containing protein [Micropruina sp.]|nr:MAG: DUF5134 domain-containing protein [Micropruina sp.]